MKFIKKCKECLPWWSKILLKLFFSRLPFNYQFWNNIQIFKHGSMVEAAVSLPMVLAHARDAGILDGITLNKKAINVLEFGPGDSISSAIIFDALGANKCHLIDVDDYATRELGVYLDLVALMVKMGITCPPSIVEKIKGGEYFNNYKTSGFNALKQIPDKSIDYSFSNAVLEHVHLEQLQLLLGELKRVSVSGALSFHRVDLKDHLSESLNSLRFNSIVWESELFKTSGFYTNRLRLSDWKKILEENQLSYKIHRVRRWDKLPVAKNKMNIDFSGKSEEDLLVHGFDLIVKF